MPSELPQVWRQREQEANWIRKAAFGMSHDTDTSRLLMDIYESQSQNYKLHHALIWADNFSFPEGICDRDTLRLQLAVTLPNMVRNIHVCTRMKRLNIFRIQACIPLDYEERYLLVDLAKGIRVFHEDSFVPNTMTVVGPPPLRNKYIAA